MRDRRRIIAIVLSSRLVIPSFTDFAQAPGTERVINADMELDDSSWSNLSSPSVNAQSSEQAHGGTFSRKVTANGSTGIEQVVTVDRYHWYEYRGWLYLTAGQAKLATSNPVIALNSHTALNAWKYSTLAFYTQNASATVRAFANASATTFYADDLSLKDIVLTRQQVAYSATQPITFEFILPVSPGIGQAARLFFRIQGPLSRNYWMVQVVFGGATWGLDIVTSNPNTATQLSLADVGGTPDALRVSFSGTVVTPEVRINGSWVTLTAVNLDLLPTRTGVNAICSTGVTPVRITGVSGQALVSTQTLYSSVSNPDWLGRPRLCKVSSGLWALIYRAATDHGFDASSVFIIRFSTDEGRTWTAANTYIDGGAVTGFPIMGHSGQNIADAEIFLIPNGDLMILASEFNVSSQDRGTYIYRAVAGATIGKSWTDEGKLLNDNTTHANGQFITIGNTLYGTMWEDPDTNKTPPWTAGFYSADSNGQNFTRISTIKVGANEGSIISLGGNNLYGLFRDDSLSGQCYEATSTDLGANWSVVAQTLFGTLQRPRLLQFAGDARIYLFGRFYDENQNLLKTVMWWTLNPIAAAPVWYGPFFPNETFLAEGGYCDMQPRADGTHYLVTDEGSSSASDSIIEYVMNAPAAGSG